jgi:glucose dehydrogenase
MKLWKVLRRGARTHACNVDTRVDAQPYSTWKDYGGAADSMQYSSLKQIDKKNVARLELAWTYPVRGSTDARTGVTIPSFGSEGRVDLRQGIPLARGIATGTPDRIFENLIILARVSAK